MLSVEWLEVQAPKSGQKFIYKSNLRRERMPEWLKYITDYTLEEFNSLFPIGLKFDFEMLEWSIKDDLRMLGKDQCDHGTGGG